MNNLNSILVEGNIVRDAEIRTTPKGTSVCNLTIASNRFFKQDSGIEKEVSFFNVEVWGKLVESCANLGSKGRGIRIVGRLKQERWKSSDGQSRSRIFIVAEHIEFRPNFAKQDERFEMAEEEAS